VGEIESKVAAIWSRVELIIQDNLTDY